MESHKDVYLESFTKRVGVDAVDKMKETIIAEEEKIRASYEQGATEWVLPESFVDHILKDSVFIMELIIRLHVCTDDKSDDKILDSAYYTSRVRADLMLLENQLPYFIFEKLFCSALEVLEAEALKKAEQSETPEQPERPEQQPQRPEQPETGEQDVAKKVEKLILKFFSLKIERENTPTFMHFTDMYRCVYEDSLKQDTPSLEDDLSTGTTAIEKMPNADDLARVGVKFKFDQLTLSKGDKFKFKSSDSSTTPQQLESIVVIGEEAHDNSLYVAFTKGCLMMSFRANDTSDRILRNVIAYEQCHSGLKQKLYTSNYTQFINFLITNVEDVEVLTAEGVLRHGGNRTLVVEMVNNLNRGLPVAGNSQYHSIAVNLKSHYKSRRKRCWATLKRVYFPDLLTGTASGAAMFLLFLTLVGTVASVLQAYKSFKVPPAKHD